MSCIGKMQIVRRKFQALSSAGLNREEISGEIIAFILMSLTAYEEHND